MKDTDVTDYDALINSDDISHEVKLALIEKKYSLPANVTKLKSDLYSDLLEKYYSVRQFNKHYIEEHIKISDEKKELCKQLDMTEKLLEHSLNLIYSLLDEPTVENEQAALNFLQSQRELKHIPGSGPETKVFALRKDITVTVEAKTKEEAAQLLNISKRQVVCISDYHPNKK